MASNPVWHWRALIGLTVLTLAAGFLTPKFAVSPDLEEKRALAFLPTPPRALNELDAYRKGMDAYVADHFPARPYLIGWLNAVRLPLRVSGSDRVIIGKQGWMFYDDGSHLGAVRNDPPLDAAAERQALYALAGRTEYLASRGAKYLVVSPPQKEAVYPQMGPNWLKVSPNRLAAVLPSDAKAAGAGDILYLMDAMQAPASTSQKLFSRYETHWTGLGAYFGYVGLMKHLETIGVGEAPRPLSEFQQNPVAFWGPRDLAMMLGVSTFVRLDYQDYSDSGAEDRLFTTYLSADRSWTGPQVIDTGQIGKPVLLLTRDSFSNALQPFLYTHFSRVILSHLRDGVWREDLINQYHPNVVVLEVIEAGLKPALVGGPQPSEAARARIDAVAASRFAR